MRSTAANQKPFSQRCPVAVLMLLAGLVIGVQNGQAYEHRRDTPSVGGKVQYGALGTEDDWGEIFRWGGGVCINIRQYIGRSRAIGLTLELQTFNRRGTVPKSADGTETLDADELETQILMVDYYIYMQRKRRRTPYVVISGGFYRPQLMYKFIDASGNPSEHVEYPGEGFILRTGLGLEYFLTRNFSIDGLVSGYYLSTPGVSGITLSGQASIGVQVYFGR